MRFIAATLLALSFMSTAEAKVQTKLVEYKQGDAVLEGFLAWDDAQTGQRPGILVSHAWMGIDENTRQKTVALAEQGYVAFAADIYGKGVRPTTPAEAGAQAGKFKGDRALLRARVNAGLAQLKSQPGVDGKKVAAVGYCFGGTTVLELARSGADVAGVVSVHGGLDSLTPADAANIKGSVLVLHGDADPYISATDFTAFFNELKAAKIDYQLVAYAGAVHAFTDPKAGNDPSRGAAYHPVADKRSWKAMLGFFQELFTKA